MHRLALFLTTGGVAALLAACSPSPVQNQEKPQASSPAPRENATPESHPNSKANLIALTDANFDDTVLKSPTPVFVDFWAEWCGPCKIIAPVFAELASTYEGKIKFGKLDIDKNAKVTEQYGITAIPALLLFKNGRVVETVVGVKRKQDLQALLDKHSDTSPAGQN